MTDIVIILILASLVMTYVFIVIRRRKKEKEVKTGGMDKFDGNSELDEHKKQNFVEKIKEKEREAKANIETHLVNYAVYRLSAREFIFNAGIAILFLGFLGYLFYESWIMAGILGAFGLMFPFMRKKSLLAQRKEKLNLQFKEAIASLSSSLAAGRSIENSFKEVVDDLYLLYPDPSTYIIREFEIINRRVENGETIERAVQDFGIRSDIEDIMNFANVFITCKRTGGNLVEVIRRTSDIISEKIDIQQDVSVMLAQKKFESRIMSLAPIGMILLLKYSAADYLAPMYQWGEKGPLIMTVCLGILGFSYWMGQRIMNIKV